MSYIHCHTDSVFDEGCEACQAEYVDALGAGAPDLEAENRELRAAIQRVLAAVRDSNMADAEARELAEDVLAALEPETESTPNEGTTPS